MRKFFVSRLFPLISERCLRSGGSRLFVVGRAGDTVGWLSNWRLILFFVSITGQFRVLGSRRCGSGGWVRKFFVSRLFPLISERCLRSGGSRLFVVGRAGDTVGWLSNRRLILFFVGITGQFRVLGSRLCGSGGWVRKFHVPAHFRALPPFRRGQAVRWGPCGGHGWVAVELAADFVFCGHNRTFPGVGFLPVREWRFGAEFFCIPFISAHFRALPPDRRGQAARLGPCGGHGWVAVELAADFVYCGHNRTFPGTGRVPARCRGRSHLSAVGSGAWFGKH